jgi:hypothetical protein
MTKPVTREELVDFETYREERVTYRPKVMALKAPRRIHVGEYLTFLFENHETVRYQVQEMMLAERIVKDAEIRHELQTYNELLGGPGGLGASLLIEIVNEAERNEKLTAWLALPGHLYAKLADGTKVRPTFDARQIGDSRLSSVHYLRFPVQGKVPVALGCDLPSMQIETPLTAEQRAALEEDLSS